MGASNQAHCETWIQIDRSKHRFGPVAVLPDDRLLERWSDEKVESAISPLNRAFEADDFSELSYSENRLALLIMKRADWRCRRLDPALHVGSIQLDVRQIEWIPSYDQDSFQIEYRVGQIKRTLRSQALLTAQPSRSLGVTALILGGGVGTTLFLSRLASTYSDRTFIAQMAASVGLGATAGFLAYWSGLQQNLPDLHRTDIDATLTSQSSIIFTTLGCVGPWTQVSPQLLTRALSFNSLKAWHPPSIAPSQLNESKCPICWEHLNLEHEVAVNRHCHHMICLRCSIQNALKNYKEGLNRDDESRLSDPTCPLCRGPGYLSDYEIHRISPNDSSL